MLRLLSFTVFLATWWGAALLAGGEKLPPPPVVLAAIIAEANSGAIACRALPSTDTTKIFPSAPGMPPATMLGGNPVQ